MTFALFLFLAQAQSMNAFKRHVRAGDCSAAAVLLQRPAARLELSRPPAFGTSNSPVRTSTTAVKRPWTRCCCSTAETATFLTVETWVLESAPFASIKASAPQFLL